MSGRRARKRQQPTTAAKRTRTPVYVAALAVAVTAGGAYLWLRPGGTPDGQADAGNATLVALGGEVYAAQCAECHGAGLEGQPNWREPLPTGGRPAPPHDETGHTWHHPDGQLFAITKYGGQPFSPQGYRNNMPAFEGRLGDREIWAALAYIKSRWPAEIRERQAAITARTR